MATTAFYIPVVGNFNPAAGFAFQNSAGDNVPILAGDNIGPGRPGWNTMGLVWFIGGGPIGDDASFVLKIPYPIQMQQNIMDTNFNFYLPVGSSFQVFAGSNAMEPFFQGQPNITTNTFDFNINFASPVAATFAISFSVNFGHTITN
jgi:hypothetical protein